MTTHYNDLPPAKVAAEDLRTLNGPSGSGNGEAVLQTSTVVAEEPPNIFLASQRGDLETVRRLIDSGQAKATDRDDQNITPLHWAAINAQLPVCKYLLEQGAEVDALGGDLVATPMQWAARNGYLYIIDLLIAHNADPMIADSQGYNTLHLVTHSSTVMPLLYLIHLCPISPDTPDSAGHTPLMWAAYQGDAVSVEILLRAGASPLKKDDTGLTALHWAVVRGNKFCIRKLIEAGADLNARDDKGKTAKEMATDLKSLGPWKKALEEGGLGEDGRKIPGPLSERNSKLAILLLPSAFLYLIFSTISIMPWFTGIPLAAAEFFGMHHITTRVLLNHKNYTENVTASPYFAGIIAASIFWVAEAWLTRLLPVTKNQGYAFAHLFFVIMLLLCAYNFFRAVTLDPGACPKPGNEEELKTFLVFVITLVLGIISFDYLTVGYFSSPPLPVTASEPPLLSTSPPHKGAPEDPAAEVPSCVFADPVCVAMRRDAFLFSVACWATLQLTWTLLLLASQIWQVMRQMTTLEVSNLGRYGYMGGKGGSHLGHTQLGQAHTAGEDADGQDAHNHHGHSHGKGGICGRAPGLIMSVLGFDRFTKYKAADGLARAAKAPNPFDLGYIGNCKDFWTTGRELGVDYDQLYDVPADGFREAKRRKLREEADEGFALGHHKRGSGNVFSRTMSMGRSLTGLGGGGRATGRGYGYEP
ncbi:palmitoyltransferase akr1, partial [Tulasnella sp. 331]